MESQINPIDELLPFIAQAVAEWKAENDEATIKRRVTQLLNANSKEITMKLLGFDSSWDKEWELDHCNGRAGQSTAGKFIANAQSEAIREWLSTVVMPKLDSQVKSRLLKAAQSEYESHLRVAVSNALHSKANADANLLVTTLTKSNNVDDLIKAMRLIDPSGE